MGIFDYLRGWSELEVQGAVPERVLNAMAARNIPFWGVRKQDGCTMRFKVRRKYVETASGLARKSQCTVTDSKASGEDEGASYAVCVAGRRVFVHGSAGGILLLRLGHQGGGK